jgi:ABC-2 type transport system permease protein
MTALISTEWRKLLTTRGPLAALAGLLVLSVAVTVGGMGDIGSGTATETADAREVLVLGSGLFASLVLLVLGTLAATGEFQHRTAVTTYLITPRRGRVLGAKLIAHAIVGALVSAVLAAVTFPIVLYMADDQGVHVAGTAGVVGAAAAVVAAGALSSVLGVAAGSILRNQTTALLVVLLWVLVAERFLLSPLPSVFPFGGLLGGIGLAGDEAPSPLQGIAVAVAWAGTLAAVARWRFIGRDVA